MTRVHRIKGDGDFIAFHIESHLQNQALMDAEEGKQPYDPSMVVRMAYCFTEPEQEGVVTDFPYLSDGTCLVISARAVQALRPFLDQAGILLDVTIQDCDPAIPSAHDAVMSMGYKLFVCTTALDALDEERIERFPDAFSAQQIQAYAFRPAAVAEAGLFRAARLWNRIFATDPVVAAVEEHELTGLQTRAMWSNEDGPLVRLEDSLLEFGQHMWRHDAKKVREKRQAMRARIAERGLHGGR